MRDCPSCHQLIHDAAVICRFCEAAVGDESALPPAWQEFVRDYYQGSKAERLELWNDLSPKEKSFVQKVLGLESPELMSFTSPPKLSEQIREEAESDSEPEAELPPGLEELDRLLGGYALLAVMAGLLVVAVGVAHFSEIYLPGSEESMAAVVPAETEEQADSAATENQAQARSDGKKKASGQSRGRSGSSSSRSMVNPVNP